MTLQWTIFQADLDPTMGREQSGERPVLVISAEAINQRYDVVTIIPVTSRKNQRSARLGEMLLPAGTAGLRVDSFALCYQSRVLDKMRLTATFGTITDEKLRQDIRDMLMLCLDLP